MVVATNRKPTNDFPILLNTSVCAVCHHFDVMSISKYASLKLTPPRLGLGLAFGGQKWYRSLLFDFYAQHKPFSHNAKHGRQTDDRQNGLAARKCSQCIGDLCPTVSVLLWLFFEIEMRGLAQSRLDKSLITWVVDTHSIRQSEMDFFLRRLLDAWPL